MATLESLDKHYSMYNKKLDLEITFEEYYKIIKCEAFLIWTTLTDDQKKIYKNDPERLFEILLMTDTEFELKEKILFQ